MKTIVLTAFLAAACDVPPSVRGMAEQLTGDGTCSTNQPLPGTLNYQGGAVMFAPVNVYFIFYGDWNGNGSEQLILHNLVEHLGGTPWFNINTMYTQSNGLHPINNLQRGADYYDSGSQGTSLSDGQIENIITHALDDPNGLNYDPYGIYAVFTSYNIHVSDFCHGYCGWHDHYSHSLVDLKYTFVGDPYQCPTSCMPGCNTTISPNGNPYGDAMASAFAHELSEAVTDPDRNGWINNGTTENADKCAWVYGTTYTTSNGSLANVHLGIYDYLLQQNWVRFDGGYCATAHAVALDDLICSDTSNGNIWAGYDTYFHDEFTLNSTPLFSWCGAATQRLLLGDVDADGHSDFICSDSADGSNRVIYNYGNGYRNAGVVLANWCGGPNGRVVVADMDGDGRADLVCNDIPSGTTWIAFSTGSGFRTGPAVMSGWCTTTSTRLLTGDVDGDGKFDLVCNNTADGRDWVAFSTGTGFRTGAPLLNNWCYGSGARLAVGDIDNDGRADLVCNNQTTGYNWFIHSTGSGFTNSTVVSTNYCSGSNSRFLLVDITHDGMSDLICQDSGTGAISVADSTGTGINNHGVAQTASWCLGSNTRLQAANADGLNASQ